jgi:hypothetical protein
MTSLTEKLQLKEGESIRILGAPPEFRLGANPGKGKGDALLVFAVNKKALKAHEGTILEYSRADRLTWVAYPKAGQLGTDLSRDLLATYFSGVQGVRMVSIDDVWSALRLRPIQS